MSPLTLEFTKNGTTVRFGEQRPITPNDVLAYQIHNETVSMVLSDSSCVEVPYASFDHETFRDSFVEMTDGDINPNTPRIFIRPGQVDLVMAGEDKKDSSVLFSLRRTFSGHVVTRKLEIDSPLQHVSDRLRLVVFDAKYNTGTRSWETSLILPQGRIALNPEFTFLKPTTAWGEPCTCIEFYDRHARPKKVEIILSGCSREVAAGRLYDGLRGFREQLDQLVPRT